jgi:hypothetical protein
MSLIYNTLKEFSSKNKEQRGHWITLPNSSFANQTFLWNPI